MSDTCRTTHSTGHDGLIGLFLPLHTQRRIERDGAEPVVGVVITVSGLGMHCDARDTGQQLLVELLHMLMMGDMVISHRHLTAPDTCAYITHTVVVTDFLMLIIRVALTVLGGIHHHLAPRIVIRGDQRTATRGGNHLIAVERQHTIPAERTQRLPLITRAETLCGILYHGDIVATGNLHDTVYLIGHAIECHGHNGLRRLSGLGDSVFDGLLEQVGVHVPGIFLRVYEHRCCTEVGDGMRRRTESKALHQHLIARTNAAGNQRQMHGSCSRTQRHHTFAVRLFSLIVQRDKRFQVFLEAVDIRSKGNHPVSVKSLLNIFFFHTRLTHVGQAQIYSFIHIH